MLSIFKDKSIVTFFFLVLLAFAVHAHLFLHPQTIATTDSNGLFSFFVNRFFINIIPSIAAFIYVAIVLLQSIRLNLLLNDLRMYNNSGFTASLSYILLTGILPQWSALTTGLIANSFVIWIFILLSKLYNSATPKSTLFNIGLLVGISFLCYHPTIILIAIALFALAVVRPFILSEWFVLLMGLITPIYFFISFLYLYDKMYIFYSTLPHFAFNMPIKNTDIWLWIKMSSILLTILIGFQIYLNQNNRMIIQIRKNWGIMVVMLLIMLPIPFIFKNGGLDFAILCLVPLSAFIGNVYLYPKKSILPNCIFLVSVVLIIHSNWLLIKH